MKSPKPQGKIKRPLILIWRKKKLKLVFFSELKKTKMCQWLKENVSLV